jgi:hypothetical protein
MTDILSIFKARSTKFLKKEVRRYTDFGSRSRIDVVDVGGSGFCTGVGVGHSPGGSPA